MDLPAGVRELLCEYQVPDSVDGAEWERAIIERVMLRGRWDDMRWLVSAFERARLRAFLAERGSRVLPPRELAFWALACAVPRETADSWTTQARAREWRG